MHVYVYVLVCVCVCVCSILLCMTSTVRCAFHQQYRDKLRHILYRNQPKCTQRDEPLQSCSLSLTGDQSMGFVCSFCTDTHTHACTKAHVCTHTHTRVSRSVCVRQVHALACMCAHVCVFARAQCTCFVFRPLAYHEMSCQTFPAIECEQDCSLLYTLTVCPRCCADCKTKRVFEVQSTTSAIKRKLKEEPLWICVKYLTWWWWAVILLLTSFKLWVHRRRTSLRSKSVVLEHLTIVSYHQNVLPLQQVLV